MSRRAWFAVLLLIAVWALVACDRLQPAAPDGSGGVDLSDPDVGGGAGEEAGPETPLPPATPTREPSPRLDATAAAGLPTAEPLPTRPPEPTTQSPTAAPTAPVEASPSAESSPPVAESSPAPAETPSPTVGAESPSPAPQTSPTPAGETNDAGEIIHTVQPGENLYRIGLKYGVSWVIIAEYNGIADPNAITVGQEIRIPPAPTATLEAQSFVPVGPAAVSSNIGATTKELPPAVESPVIAAPPAVTVTPGDTLYSIARRYGVSWDQVAEANGLAAPNQIYAGQVLKIPADVPGPTQSFSHQVHRGDTLSRIAGQYGVSLAELAEANNLAAPYVIYPGQALTIPGE